MISPRTKRFMRPQTSASPPPATPPAPIGQVSDGTANRRDAEWLSDARWYYELHEKRNNSAQTRAVPVMAFSAADPPGPSLAGMLIAWPQTC